MLLSGKTFLSNGSGYSHVAKLRGVTLAVLQAPTKKVTNGVDGFDTLIALAQQYPGKGYNRIRICAPWIGNKGTEIRRDVGRSQGGPATLLGWLYELAVPVLQSRSSQTNFLGKLIPDVANRSVGS